MFWASDSLHWLVCFFCLEAKVTINARKFLRTFAQHRLFLLIFALFALSYLNGLDLKKRPTGRRPPATPGQPRYVLRLWPGDFTRIDARAGQGLRSSVGSSWSWFCERPKDWGWSRAGWRMSWRKLESFESLFERWKIVGKPIYRQCFPSFETNKLIVTRWFGCEGFRHPAVHSQHGRHGGSPLECSNGGGE